MNEPEAGSGARPEHRGTDTGSDLSRSDEGGSQADGAQRMPRSEPSAARPHMPGYGLLPADKGSGLLPWSWALERLRNSRNYWLTTVWPDGRPHVMPVWAVWLDGPKQEGTLWFSSGLRSRKIRNILAGSDVS